MMDDEFKNYVLQTGITLGVIYGIILFGSYFIGVEYMVSRWTIVPTLLLGIAAPIYIGVKWKNNKGGFLDFKSAFLVIFFTCSLSTVITSIFNYVLNTIIDPGLPEALLNESLKMTVDLLENLGTPEEAIDQAIEDAKAEGQNYGIGTVLTQLLWSLGFAAIYHVIVAAIIKKNPPVFEQEGNE